MIWARFRTSSDRQADQPNRAVVIFDSWWSQNAMSVDGHQSRLFERNEMQHRPKWAMLALVFNGIAPPAILADGL